MTKQLIWQVFVKKHFYAQLYVLIVLTMPRYHRYIIMTILHDKRFYEF